MEIRIVKNKKSNVSDTYIDFHLVRNEQITESEVLEYQEVFGKIVASDIKQYLLSDLLNREDGSTHFLNKILKLLTCINLIQKSDNNLYFFNIDRTVLISLRNYCKENNIEFIYSKSAVLRNRIKKQLRFVLVCFRSYVADSVVSLYSKYKLRSRINVDAKKVFISYFDYRSVNGNKFTDPFFYPLQEQLTQIGTPFSVVNIIMYGYNIKKGLRYINEIKRTNNSDIITLFNLIPFLGIFSSFIKSFFSRPKLKHLVLFKGCNITDFVRENLFDEFYSGSIQYSLERMYVCELFKYSSIETIYYPFENFAWEKSLCMEKDRLKSNIRLVGFQHTSFSLKLQHHFPSIYEKDLPIFPDKIITVGEISKDVLEKYGFFPRNLLQIGCALRHSYIYDILCNYKKTSIGNSKIAFAFSFDLSRYDVILNKLISIFGNKDITVILKYHPLNKEYHFNRLDMPSNFVNGINLSWKEVMSQIDLLLYEGNSVSVDALAYNIPPLYFPFTGDIYDTNQLYNYQWDLDIGNNESSYFEKVKGMLKKELKNNDDFFTYNKKYVESYFYPISENSINKFLN